MGNWIANGKPRDSVAIDERALHYGDGLFETIAMRNGEPRLWHYHMDRLAEGCERLKLAMPSTADLRDGVNASLLNSNVPSAYAVVKIIVSAGISRRGYGRSPGTLPTILFGAFTSRPAPISAYTDGVDTTVCELRLATKSPLAGLKTLNRLEQVLARSELSGKGVFEGLTLDADNRLICGTMSNVFFVEKKSIITPPTDSSGVSGVMRRHVIETLRSRGTNVEIRDVGVDTLQSADEVFLSNSQFTVMPVRACDEHQWPVGPVTQSVIELLATTGVSENMR